MRPRRKGPSPDINVTPLVDVVLVLLIIFMVVTPKMEAGPPVELPRIANAEQRGESAVEPLVVSVTSDGAIHLDDADAPVPVNLLRESLKEELDKAPDRRVVVKGDRAARYAQVRTVFAACRELGFKGVSLHVEQRAGAGG